MKQNPAELVKNWRAESDARLSENPDDIVGQVLRKCANDLDFALRSGSNSKMIATAMLATAAGAILVGENVPARPFEWHNRAISGTLAAPPDALPSTPPDHTEPDGGEETFVNVSSPAVSGTNVDAHALTSSALLAFESNRRLERPFVFCGDFDYSVLRPLPEDNRAVDSAEPEKNDPTEKHA